MSERTYKFIKQQNGNVLLLNAKTDEFITSFIPSMTIKRDKHTLNRFEIMTVLFDYQNINKGACFPVIEAANFDDFLRELSDNFFFFYTAPTFEGITIFQNVETFFDLFAGSVVGDISYVKQSQGTAWLIGALGGTYYPAGWYLWNGTNWVSDKNAIANAINEIVLKDDLSEYNNLSNNPFVRQNDLNNSPIDGGIIF